MNRPIQSRINEKVYRENYNFPRSLPSTMPPPIFENNELYSFNNTSNSNNNNNNNQTLVFNDSIKPILTRKTQNRVDLNNISHNQTHYLPLPNQQPAKPYGQQSIKPINKELTHKLQTYLPNKSPNQPPTYLPNKSLNQQLNQQPTYLPNKSPNQQQNQLPNKSPTYLPNKPSNQLQNKSPTYLPNQPPNKPSNQPPNKQSNQLPNQQSNQQSNQLPNQLPNKQSNQLQNQPSNQLPNQPSNQPPNQPSNQQPNQQPKYLPNKQQNQPLNQRNLDQSNKPVQNFSLPENINYRFENYHSLNKTFNKNEINKFNNITPIDSRQDINEELRNNDNEQFLKMQGGPLVNINNNKGAMTRDKKIIINDYVPIKKNIAVPLDKII